MCFDIIKRFAILAILFLSLVSCGVNNNADSPGFSSALAQVPLEDRRIAIVHSQTSKTAFYDAFAYNQLFAAVQQQSMMAGLPFDLLDEAGLASTANLLDYDAIVIPMLSHVNSTDRQAIKARLLQAQENGVGIITSGEFMGFEATGASHQNFDSAMVEVLGVFPSLYLNGVSASVKVTDNTHPVNKPYAAGEELTAYEQIWFGHFVPVGGEQSTQLSVIESGGVTYNGAQVIERTGRVVHFANEAVMADNNQLWRVIQWVVYGDVAPVSLQLSRSDHIFLARNDMDQAMIAEDLSLTEIPLLDLIKDWKRDHNFVGSYYIDIGNNPNQGEYTDWSVSAPLYNEYIDLGNEIGTHSWTHPHYTSDLTAAELEFEFKDSAAEIGNRIGVPVTGAAIPGNPESLFVVETLNPWLEYLSGRSGVVGSGFAGAFGFLEPQHDMMYFSLNMSPDYTLIDYLNNTPAQATAIWRNELDTVLKNARQPIVHWLWHDYGPTTQTAAGLYSLEMFTDTIAYAKSRGAEFATVQDMQDRMRNYAAVNFSVGSSSVITANVGATGVGQFALKIAEGETIKRVENWYAYDEDQVFLPETGGEFTIEVGPVADLVTRISSLPMRARLMSLTGDGHQLNFTVQGEGELTIVLSDQMVQNSLVSGADSYIENDGVLTLRLDNNAVHEVTITANQGFEPEVPTLISPLETVDTASPAFSWEAPGGAVNKYHLQVFDRTVPGWVHSKVYSASAICSEDSCSQAIPEVLGSHSYHVWRVRAYNEAGWGAFNTNQIFGYLPTSVPEVPILVSPLETVDTASPTFSWEAPGGAVNRYHLQVFDRTVPGWVHNKVYSASAICSEGSCSQAIPEVLGFHSYHVWRVRGYNADGWGAFNANEVFAYE